LAGFQFAFSFTPDQTEDTRNVLDGAATRLRNNPHQNSENLSMAGVFTHDFNGVKLTLGGAHTFSFNKEVNPNNVDPGQDSNAYAQVSYAGFTIGAAMEYRQNFGDTSADQLVFGAGVTYNWDLWTVGLGWTRGDYEKAVGANGVGPFDAVHDDIALTASYALGPGISIDGLLEYSPTSAMTPPARITGESAQGSARPSVFDGTCSAHGDSAAWSRDAAKSRNARSFSGKSR